MNFNEEEFKRELELAKRNEEARMNARALLKGELDALRTRLTASESARRGLVEALEEIGRTKFASSVDEAIRLGGNSPVLAAETMHLIARSALAASAKLDGNP